MKKLLFSVLSLSVMSKMEAQFTLTTSSPIGYSVNIAIASPATATLVPIATTGIGVTWNCSALATGTNPIVDLVIGNTTGKPYALDYPQSNRNVSVSYLTNLISNEFEHSSVDSLVSFGSHVSGSSYEIYDNPEIVLKFPFAYADVYSNNYSKTNYNALGGITSYQTGTNTLTYDGHGTLILPSGTIPNVARIKNVRTNSLGPTTTSYLWISSSGERLLLYQTNGGVKVTYVNALQTSIQAVDNATDKLLVYPSVTNGSLNINSSKVLNYYKIYNSAGQLIVTENNKNLNQFSLEINALPGIYLLEVGNNEFKKFQKIILTD